MLNALIIILKAIIVLFAIFGAYIFYNVFKMAYLQVKIKNNIREQSQEEMKESLERFAEKYNKTRG